jgi:hypothetical protein
MFQQRRLVRALAVGGALVAAVLGAAGCRDDGGSAPASGGGQATTARETTAQTTIDQPVVEGVRVAPESERVDLAAPTFSDPTNVTNPLFPVSQQASVLLLGRVDGQAFRTEVTLLPETRIIEWQGQRIEALVSQYAAFLGGRIHEVAYDFYAQDDAGAVWYLGEDVFNFKDGAIADTHGTWIAGKDGPAAMIMPADPQVGDVYRPENIPGLIFEEVTVKAVGETRDGPVGPVKGVMIGQELHMEGDLEDKAFAPGYGELRSGLGEDVEATALAVPANALSEPLPAELPVLLSDTVRVMDAARLQDWAKASAGIDDLRAAYDAHREREPAKMLDAQMAEVLDRLAEAVKARDTHTAPLAALDVALAAADLTLRYRLPAEVDFMRLDLWARQLVADAEAGEKGAVAGDVATMGWIRDRIALDRADAEHIDDQLRFLAAAADAKDMTSAATAAERLRRTLAGLAPR